MPGSEPAQYLGDALNVPPAGKTKGPPPGDSDGFWTLGVSSHGQCGESLLSRSAVTNSKPLFVKNKYNFYLQ